MESDGLFLREKQPAIRPYLESHESSPHLPIPTL
jgi:hypothetical protein